MNKEQQGSPTTSSLPNTKQREDASVFQMNPRAEWSARAFETNASLFLLFYSFKKCIIYFITLARRARMEMVNSDDKNG